MIPVLNRLEAARSDESGFTTAELLGNAALGILALVVIWAAIGGLGQDVMNMLHDNLVK